VTATAAPTAPEEELALLLSGTQERRESASARIGELAASADESELLVFLHRQRMLLLLLERLEAETDRRLSAEAATEIGRTREFWSHRASMFRLGASLVTDLLEGDGIPALNLKGVALADRLYGDPSLRTFSDLDILVPARSLAEAADRCETLGYEPYDEEPGDLPTLHRRLRSEAGVLPPLELHWRVHWYEREFATDMLARTELVEGSRVPDPLDDLASLLLFYARDGFVGLRHAAAIGAWWDGFGAAVAPGRLGAYCDRYPELAPAWRAACAAADRLVGLPAGRLLGRARMRRREGVAVRLVNWRLEGDVDRMSADAQLVDGLCTPARQGLEFLRRTVVPGAAYIREAYELPPDARFRTALWAVVHPPKMLARYALSFWSARRG
jgi:hypothetical protein